MLREDIKRHPKNDLIEDASESEYTDTDWSESEESSNDSGLGFPGGQEKIVDSPHSSVPLPDFSEKEQKTAEYLADWIKGVADPDRDIVIELQERFGKNLTECKVKQKYCRRPVLSLIGSNDRFGNLHGDAEIYYANGDFFWGTFKHCRRSGNGTEGFQNGETHTGMFKNGYLDGLVTETLEENVQREVFYDNGVRHGFYREFGPSKQFLAIGIFVNGKKRGSHWCWSTGDSFLVGSVDEENKPDGENIFFLYPDLTTTLCGNYSHGKLSKGRIVRLDSVKMDCGIPVPVLRESEDSSTFSYDPSGANRISKTPQLRDPYEKRYVYVKESDVLFAGEGLWAKTAIKAGQVCALFNGVRHNHRRGGSDLPWSDYRISCEKGVDLDILPAHVSTHNYRATLGHKTCHSFSPNCDFAQFWHPRHGLIMSIVATRDIRPGEELYASYNYEIAVAPDWYQEQWFRHVREKLSWSEQQIRAWARKMNRMNSVALVIPTR